MGRCCIELRHLSKLRPVPPRCALRTSARPPTHLMLAGQPAAAPHARGRQGRQHATQAGPLASRLPTLRAVRASTPVCAVDSVLRGTARSPPQGLEPVGAGARPRPVQRVRRRRLRERGAEWNFAAGEAERRAAAPRPVRGWHCAATADVVRVGCGCALYAETPTRASARQPRRGTGRARLDGQPRWFLAWAGI